MHIDCSYINPQIKNINQSPSMFGKAFIRTWKNSICLNFIPHKSVLQHASNNHFTNRKLILEGLSEKQSQKQIINKDKTLYRHEQVKQSQKNYQIQLDLTKKRVGQNYWATKYEKLQPVVKRIINLINFLDLLYEQAKQMVNNDLLYRKNKSRIESCQRSLVYQIDSYLVFDQLKMHQNRTSYGISALILAIDQSHSKRLKLFLDKAVDFFNPYYFQQRVYIRHRNQNDIKAIQQDNKSYSIKDIDMHMVISLLKSLNVSIMSKPVANQKTKVQFKFVKLLKAVTVNHPKHIQTQGQWSMFVQEHQLELLIQQCINFTDKKANNQTALITRMQFAFKYITDRLIKISTSSNPQHIKVPGTYLAYSYLQLAKRFQFQDRETGQKMLSIFMQFLDSGNQEIRAKKIINCLNKFPIFIYYDKKTKKIDDIRNRLVLKANQIFRQDTNLKKYFKQIDYYTITGAFKKCILLKFHQRFLSLDFSVIQNHTLIIFSAAQHQKSKELTSSKKSQKIDDQTPNLDLLPQIDQLNKYLYRIFYKHINKISNLREIIKRYYPDVFIQDSQYKYHRKNEQLFENQDHLKIQHLNQSQDNELSLLTVKVLNLLDIKFEKQKSIIGRKVDFYLSAYNLIIEVDGNIHFDNRTMPDYKTCSRNLTFLNAGYNLMIITHQDVNQNRQITKLKELFLKKLELMKNHNASYVF